MLRKNKKSSSNIIFISIVSQSEKRILYESVYTYIIERVCACVRRVVRRVPFVFDLSLMSESAHCLPFHFIGTLASSRLGSR